MKPYTRENFQYAFGFTHNISKYSQFCKNKNKTAFFYVVSLPIGAKNFIVLLDKLKVFLFTFYCDICVQMCTYDIFWEL